MGLWASKQDVLGRYNFKIYYAISSEKNKLYGNAWKNFKYGKIIELKTKIII